METSSTDVGVVLRSAEIRFIYWRDPDVLQMLSDRSLIETVKLYPDMINARFEDNRFAHR